MNEYLTYGGLPQVVTMDEIERKVEYLKNLFTHTYIRDIKERYKIKKDDSPKSFPSVGINWYPGHMAKAKRLIKENLSVIDIVYEVIDARIPYSSKIKDIDEIIQNKPKILIMTKMDLCDKKVTSEWIKYYENLGYKVIGVDLTKENETNKIITATKEMMNEINIKRKQNVLKERRTRVLIVGIPNVGKSTFLSTVTDDLNGVIFKNEKEYCEDVLKLYKDTQLRNRISSQARIQAEHCSSKTFANRVLEVYERAIIDKKNEDKFGIISRKYI